MDSKNSPKLAKKYCCETCDYYTSKITDYNKHISTAKHQSAMDGSKMVVKRRFIIHQYFHQDATLKMTSSDFSSISILTLGGHLETFFEKKIFQKFSLPYQKSW
jgi:hypothetical protein